MALAQHHHKKGGKTSRQRLINQAIRKNQFVNKKNFFNLNYKSDIETKNVISINQNATSKENYLTKRKIKGLAIFNNTLVEYLYDSGSDTTLITENLFRKIQLEDKNTRLIQYQGKPLKSFTGEVKILGQLILHNCAFNQSDHLENVNIIVTENQKSINGCIIGTDLMKIIPEFNDSMQMLEATIDNMSKNVLIRYSIINKQKEEDESKNNKLILELEKINEEQESEEDEIGLVRKHVEERLKQSAATSLKDIKAKRESKVQFRIELLNLNQKPLEAKARPLPFHLKEKVKQVIKDQEAAGIIRKSKSEWTSALRVVHKADGDIRLTVDYKPLNKIIKSDNSLPNIAEMYKKLAKSKYFSKIDLKAAYHQIPVEENSIKYTAFVCEFGVYEYTVMPMGIKTAPAWFQRFIVETFQDFIDRNVLEIYLDDFILNTVELDEHQKEADKLFDKMEKCNIKCAWNKSKMVTLEVDFLGNTISENKIYPNKNRAKCLKEKPKPETLNELQAWLGAANYLRKYIENYAEIVQPLYNIMDLKNVPKSLRKRNGAPNGKKVIVQWNKLAEEKFEMLRDILCSDLVLSLPDFDKTMIVTTDASDNGYGAVLEQNFGDEEQFEDDLRPIEYYSKSYTTPQKNYSTTEKELLAVVMAVEHFHTYVYGKKFLIYTDHLPNTLLWNKAKPHPRVERWMMRLSLYDFEIRYKPGSHNVLADFLSRPQENEKQLETSEDYLDQLVATVETSEYNETMQYQLAMNELYNHFGMEEEIVPISNIESKEYIASEHVEYEEENQWQEKINFLNINVIASQPNSSTSDNYKSYAEEQLKDDDIQWIKKLILTNGDNRPRIKQFKNKDQRIFYKEYDKLRVVDNILYRTTEDTNGYSRTQFVLPKQITKEVVEQIHTSIYNAHLGRKKTMQKITERMYRPQLKHEIINVVRTCDICQKIKQDHIKRLAELLSITATKPNQLITTDIAGPLKETERGNKYFIVVIDHFTKYIQIYPMKKIQAEDVAQILVDQWMMTFGIPDSILSDGGTQYRSKLLELVYEYLDINGLKTTPFHPQCNGQSERTVQTTKAMIRAHADANQSNWDLILNKIAFAYNTSVHQTTRTTPFELQFGRKPTIPIDILIPNTELHTRELVIKEFNTTDNEHGEITVLEDLDEKKLEEKMLKT